MGGASKRKFLTSKPSILKLVEVAILVTTMMLFLVSNRCQSLPAYVSLYILPITVSLTFLFVSYASAILVTMDGRNPFFMPAWVKGESWLNACAGILMVVGATLTLTRRACSDTPLTTVSVALGYICGILFWCSGAVTYHAFVHYEEMAKTKAKPPQLDAKDDKHAATLASIF